MWAKRISAFIGAIVIAVMGSYAFAALNDPTLPYGQLVAVLIWPLAMILVGWITISLVRGERSPTPTQAETSVQPTESAPESAETAAARARLAELEANDLRAQREYMKDQLGHAHRRAGELIINFGPTSTPPHNDLDRGWAEVQTWKQDVERTLGDPKWIHSKDLGTFRVAAADDTLLGDVAGRERLARYIRILDEVVTEALGNAI